MRHLSALAGWLGVLAGYAQAADLARFDLPSGAPICGTAIASTGAITGGPAGTASGANFIYQNGAFSFPTPSVPQGHVVMTGVNRAGTLLGYDLTSTPGIGLGFTSFKLRGNHTYVVQRPYSAWTIATGLNDTGAVVGTMHAALSGPAVGFVAFHGVWTTLDDGSGDVVPAAVDANSRRVVGSSYDVIHGGWHGWSYASGAFAIVAVPHAAATFPRGVDMAGRILGTYQDVAGISHGFVLANGVYTTIDMPGATSTELAGLNDAGQFTGCFTDAAGTHGLQGRF